MKSFSIHIFILFIMTSVSAQNYPGFKDTQGLQVGQQAPDFYQKDAGGRISSILMTVNGFQYPLPI